MEQGERGSRHMFSRGRVRGMGEEYAFVILQVGARGSPERKRADDAYNYVVAPTLRERGLQPFRSDLDPTPGQINEQMLRKLLEARVVIADPTGRNLNVFYEFGVAHSFARPVIALVDSARSLPFDDHDERVIELVADLGSANGTRLQLPDQTCEQQLTPPMPVLLLPGSHGDMGPGSTMRPTAADEAHEPALALGSSAR
jgi:hypothetical protein